MNPEKESYQAREHYQKNVIAQGYDQYRFRSILGRLAHQREAGTLQRVLGQYLTGPSSLLDLPCGTGRLFGAMLEGGHQILGGDISEEMLAKGRSRFNGESRVCFQKMEAEKIPYPDNYFDAVTSYRFMCHLPEESRRRILNEMLRVTRRYLIINFHLQVFHPLYLFNRFFRKKSHPKYPLKPQQFRKEWQALPKVRLCEVLPLAWYEQSSVLAVLEKIP